ncbi:MAG: hypothetical protein GFH27_549301n86 [Chloroflexi bacterium AL-W]|nr:hypothetical protein [Chloroflexi bacterium AL-N1]NOK68279.1 hypothetical protein [Chloroflexi bacterium AL-N10]NOK73925.1 hypothetical protein [Chloroflexi bacterium AL-N5]NOK82893.1 hypothetical protein [Chloroflexi bacterium AL-W]NOK90415.1 hypothetical protein [Chloroflexi bacterium AL-N15]
MSDTSFEIAPFDSYAERITTGVAMLGGIMMLPALFWFLSDLRFSGVIFPVAIAVTLALWLLLNYAVQPVSYEIEMTQDRFTIKRRWLRNVRIPMEEITGVSVASALADVPRRGVRQALNVGVFGYHGLFHLEQYGAAFFAATNRERLVAIGRMGYPSVIVSPARPRDFVEALREALIKRTNVELDPVHES